MATTLQRCNCQQAMKRRTSTRSRRKRQTVGCHMSCSSLKIPQRDLYACECECECVWLCMWVCGHCTPRESCNILSTRLMCLVRRCSDNRSPGHQKDEPALDKERKKRDWKRKRHRGDLRGLGSVSCVCGLMSCFLGDWPNCSHSLQSGLIMPGKS